MGSSQGCECRCGQRSARETVIFQLGCHAYRYVVHRAQRRILSSHSLINTDDARARSKFWYFLRKLRKVKKANGQIVACNEIFEKRPTTIKNFGVWVRYRSRTGEHNAYKEYRDTTLNGAVEQLYAEMASRHRVRAACMQIIKTATVPAAACKREATKQFHSTTVRFPLTTRKARPSSRGFKTTFKAVRPNVAMH